MLLELRVRWWRPLLQKHLRLLYFLPSFVISVAVGAVAPPAWADPKLNPCATRPSGWQLLYWPPDGKCYKIFQTGHPCSDGTELSPVTITTAEGEKRIAAECRCPPHTAQFARDGQCYRTFTRGPCDAGHHFAPDPHYSSSSRGDRKWGICKRTGKCRSSDDIFWPRDGRCYPYLSKGPCPRGQLITMGLDKIGTCSCNHIYEMRKYWSVDNGCYEHFTRGPCKESGHLFLPDRTCGCHDFLPHYHNDTRTCYEIGTIGPCDAGEVFQFDPARQTAECRCKVGHVRHTDTANCYRPYTQGPCPSGFMLVNETSCTRQPCKQGHLYYPADGSCHRVGTRGPCGGGSDVFTFDFETRPSIDGISYNGVCRCRRSDGCTRGERAPCGDERDVVTHSGRCYELYSRGPCGAGAWLTAKRQNATGQSVTATKEGACECMPGYRETTKIAGDKSTKECVAPAVVLAEYLNRKYFTMTINKEI